MTKSNKNFPQNEEGTHIIIDNEELNRIYKTIDECNNIVLELEKINKANAAVLASCEPPTQPHI